MGSLSRSTGLRSLRRPLTNMATMRNGKVKKVMGEYKRGTLKSSSGAKVKSRKQAVAIAMSEAGMSKKGRRRGK